MAAGAEETEHPSAWPPSMKQATASFTGADCFKLIEWSKLGEIPDIANLTSAKPFELQSLSSNTKASIRLSAISPDYTGSLSQGFHGFSYHFWPDCETSIISVLGLMTKPAEVFAGLIE